MSSGDLASGDAAGQENPAADERLRVMIVDDHEVWRIGLKQALEADGRAVVVAEATDGASAIAMAAEAMPDVVVMDMIMPTVGGAAATQRIIEQLTYAKILVVSVSGEREDVLDAIKAGASGYVLKSEPAQSIAEAVHATSRGEPVITAALAGLVLNEFRTLAAKEPNEPLLTMTETEILRLVAKGYKYREIAEQRFIALKTVQNHVQNILGKLHMHTKYELIAYAIRHGLDRAADQPAPQVSPKHE
jgi:DNA-binding NarL/FixJ family response regulator